MAMKIFRTAGELNIRDAHDGTVWPLVASTSIDGRLRLISAGPDGIRVWDPVAETGSASFLPDILVNGMAMYTTDGSSVIAVGSEDGVYRCDAVTGELLPHLDDDADTIWSVAALELSNERVMLVGAGHGAVVYRWDALTGERIGSPLVGHDDSVKAVATVTLADGTPVIVSAADDGLVRCWRAGDGQPMGDPLAGHESAVTALAVVRNGGRTLAVSGDVAGVFRVWDIESGRLMTGPVQASNWGGDLSAVMTARGLRIATSGDDQIVRQWDGGTGGLVGESLNGYSVAMSEVNGGAIIAIGDKSGAITIRPVA